MRLITPLLFSLLIPALSLAQQTKPASIVLEQGKALVLPFEQIGGDDSHRFISPALQQSLIAELGRLDSMRAVASPKSLAPDADPLQAARSLGAQYSITGSFQIVATDLRITGQVLDAQSGNSLGTFKETGGLRDLFALEDSVGSQIRKLLRPGSSLPASTTPAPTIQPSGPVQITAPSRPFLGSDLQQAVSYPGHDSYIYNPPAYPYYGYPYYTYPSYGFYGAAYYNYGYRCYPRACYTDYSCYRPIVSISSGGSRTQHIGTSAYNWSRGQGHSAGPINPVRRLPSAQ